VGLPVIGRDGQELGTVSDIYRVAENDVYVVRGPRGEFDVPAVRDFVVSIDPHGSGLTVDVEALDLPPIRPPRPYRAPRPRKGDAARARAAAEASAADAATSDATEFRAADPARSVGSGEPLVPRADAPEDTDPPTEAADQPAAG